MPEPNTDGAVAGEALEGRPGSKSVARAAEAAWNQGDPEGSRRTDYEGQAGRGGQRQEERPEARQGVGFVHSSLRQDASLEAGEGANRLTKHRSEEHTSELQSRQYLVCRLLLEKQ